MTDKIIAAAREAGIPVRPAFGLDGIARPCMVVGVNSQDAMARFYAIAFAAGMERAAEICESRQTPGTGSVAVLNGAADAIRAEAHAQNPPKTSHDGSVVSKN